MAHPYGEPKNIDEIELPEKKSPEEIAAELAEIEACPALDLRHRKLRAQTLESYDWRVALSEEDGKTPTAYYAPIERDGEYVGYRAKTISNNPVQWVVGDAKGADPFGWTKAIQSGAYRLYITTGPEDMLAIDRAFEMYGDKDWKPAVISLPYGDRSVASLNKVAQKIKSTFREVVLVYDNDDSGKQAVRDTLMILPNALSVELPWKDSNQALMDGEARKLYNAIRYQADTPKNTSLIWGMDIIEEAAEPPKWGELSWPWAVLQEKTRGIRYGETIYIGAGVKMGKSEVVNALAAHFILEDKVKVFMAKPEEANRKTLKLLAGKAVGKVFHDPKIPYTRDEFMEAAEKVAPFVSMVDLYQHVGWETLKSDIISAVHQGCKAIFIDPITNLTNGMESGEANVKLQAIAQEASALALDLGVTIFLFCHLKAPMGVLDQEKRKRYYDNGQYTGFNCSHEKGGEVLSTQFAGSRAMMRSCNLMLGLEGNRDIELPEHIRNMRWLRILEDREYGETGGSQLFWDRGTGLFKEV